jgi:hypothetical protein
MNRCIDIDITKCEQALKKVELIFNNMESLYKGILDSPKKHAPRWSGARHDEFIRKMESRHAEQLELLKVASEAAAEKLRNCLARAKAIEALGF